MAWTNKQKFLAHLYCQAAELSDQDYRDLLYQASGCRSAAHPGLTQHNFDTFMARLEGVLWQRVEEGVVERPDERRIPNLAYWRNRCPAAGEANSRQIHEIYDWWYRLQPYLDTEKRTVEYLRAIAAKATGRKVASIPQLHAWQAGVVIEAIKDRLRWALKDRAPEEAVADPAAPPGPPPADPIVGPIGVDVTDDADIQVTVETPAAAPVPECVAVSDGPADGGRAHGVIPGCNGDLPF
jgi:hypothetical protein